MSYLPIIAMAIAFLGLFGALVFFILDREAKKKRALQHPFTHFDDDELVGEKKHCDAYSAGAFYW